MMLFALGGSLVNTIIQNLKNFISILTPKNGITFEAESCSVTNLTELQNQNILDNANFILLPNNSTEAEILPTLPVPTDDIRNLIFRSEGSTTNWTLQQITAVVDGTITDPFGTQRTLRLTEVAATTPHTFNQSIPNLYGYLNDRYAFSMYIRKGNAVNAPDIMQLSFGNGFANFNINTGVVTFSGSVISTSITDAGGGWWRCGITGSFTNTVTNNPTVFVAFVNNNPTAVVRPTYSNGAGASSRNVFVFGAQFEFGSSVTTYQRNLVHPRLPSGFGSFLSANFGNYWVNSSGDLQNTPYENIIWPSIRISSLATSNTWRWLHVGLATPLMGASDPNGTFGATRINLGAGTSRGDYMMSYQTSGNNVFNPSLPTSRIRTLILFVKQDLTDRYLGIRLNNGVNTGDYGNNAVTIKVDCSNGTLANNPTSYSITYTSQFVGDGWYKVCINRTDAWDSMLFQSSAALNTINNTPSAGVLIWGVQVLNGVYDINTPTYQRELGYSVPRLNYSTSSSCPEYLIERSMYNSLLNSENFTASTWVTSAMTVSVNTEIAPNGELVADTLTATGSTASIRQSGTANGTVIQNRIFSVFLKRKTGTGIVSLDMGNAAVNVNLTTTGWTRAYIVHDALSGSYTATSGNHTVTTTLPHGFLTGYAVYIDFTTGGSPDASINSITVTGPNTFTFTNGSSTTSGNCIVYSNTGKININTSGDEVYVWGAQIESSLGFFTVPVPGWIPSSYIPTTTAQVTRASDALITNFSGSTSCSLYLELSKIGGSNNTASNYLYIGNETSSGLSTDGIGLTGSLNGTSVFSKKENNGAVTTVLTLPYTPAENRLFKTLITLSGTSLNLWMDGSLLSTTTFANPSLLDYITFDGGGAAYIKLSKIVSWPTTLSRQSIDLLFSYPYYNAGYTPVNDELQQIINRAFAEGFTLPSTTVLGYCDTLITNMKNDGVWNLTDVYFNFAYNDVTLANWARINWKNPYGGLGIASLVGLGITYQTNGFKSNGTGSLISTNFNPAIASFNFTLNNAGTMITISQIGTSLDNTFAYVYHTNGGSWEFRASAGNPFVSINSSTFSQFPSGTSNRITGTKAIMRDNSTNVRRIEGATVFTNTVTANSFGSGNMSIWNSSNPGNDSCVSQFWAGSSLTNSQIQNFRTYYNTFLTNIGLTAFA